MNPREVDWEYVKGDCESRNISMDNINKNKSYTWIIDAWAGACLYYALKTGGVFNLIVRTWHGSEHEARIAGIFAGVLTFFVFIIGFILSYLFRRYFDKHYPKTWLRIIVFILLPIVYLLFMVLIAATIRKII